MNARYLHPSAREDTATPQRGSGDTAGSPDQPADPADRACCCPAKAVVQVTVPATPARPQTDLLLCGHHYRISRRALAAASATVRGLPGTPRDIVSWIELDRQSSSCTPT